MLTAVVLAHQEEKNLPACLNCLTWCEKVIVLDEKASDFAQLRNSVLKKITTPWLMYIDADERVTPPLAAEILQNIQEIEAAPNDEKSAIVALALARQNICYGEPLHHGGWEKDQVQRVFRLSNFDGYTGKIHESPHYHGDLKVLRHKLIHLTHRSCVESLSKTAQWTPLEAQLLAAAATKKITPALILRKGIMEFYRRYFKWRGRKDGEVGFVESLTQAINRCLVYIQVWELQQKPSASTRYAREEEKIATAWQKAQE